MKRNNLPEKVFSFTAKKALFSVPCHVLVGVSGGADSMTLLNCLLDWKEAGLQVTAVHIHHGLRGDAADRDAEFVQRFCCERGVPFILRHADVAQYAETERLSLEDAGRRLRYELFERLRCDIDADYILTAHTASDQAETVLMHLIRGCGIDGLGGIPVYRGVIRRPLLCCSREEVESYCAEQSIPYVTDESNTDMRFVRNRIRHEVLPLLRSVNPSVDDALLRLSNHAETDSAYLRMLAMEGIRSAATADGYVVATIAEQPQPIRRRIIRSLMADQGISSIEEQHIVAIEKILCVGCGSVSLPNAITVSIERGRLTFHTPLPVIKPQVMAVDTMPFSADFGPFPVALKEQSVDDFQNVHKLFSNKAIDYDRIQGKLCIRCRAEGDYLHPAGRHIGKSLKKLMNEWRIPARFRDVYPILCDDVGIVLVPGYTCDERVRPTEDTKHFLVWSTDIVQG